MKKDTNKQMIENVVQLLQKENLLQGVMLADENQELQQAIENAGGVCCKTDSAEKPAVLVGCFALSQDTMQGWIVKAKEMQCALLLAEGNAGWLPLALAALSGGERYSELYQKCGCPCFTEKSLDECLKQAGFVLNAKEDIIQTEMQQGLPQNAFEAEGAQLHKTLCGITTTTVPSANTMQFVRLYRCTQEVDTQEKTSDNSPFLSVVIRTQGNRRQALREAFLCLTAQDDTDFEVLLIGHKVPEDQKEGLQELLEELPPMLQSRVRYFALDQGGRSEPINFAVSKAKGQYISVFDDDDLLTANWVSSFREAYKRAPGAILHSYAVGQDWEFVSPRSKAGLCAVGYLDQRFCTNFSWTKQLHTNYCPLMSLAFPTYLWKEMGQSLDNSLQVTEDWDFLMRMASFCGVENEASVTAIYRLWKNASNSYTKHDADYWQKQYEKITTRNQNLFILLPQGGSEDLRESHQAQLDKEYLQKVIDEREKDIANGQGAPIMDEKLYCDNGSGWTEENSFIQEKPARTGRFSFLYEDLDKHQTGTQMRWDPASYGGLIIRDLQASVTDADGKKYTFEANDIHTSGQPYENGYIFLQEDPQMYFTMPKGFVPDKFMVAGMAQTAVSIQKMTELVHLEQYVKDRPRKAAIKLLLGKSPIQSMWK